MLRLMAIVLMAVAGVINAGAADWDQEYVRTLYDGRQLAPVEGVWQFGGHGAVVAIVRSSVALSKRIGAISDAHGGTDRMPIVPESDYCIYLIDSPMLDVPPGALIGTANATPQDKVYDARLENKKLGKKSKIKSQTMTITVNPGGTLTVKPYKTGYSISLRRWLGYLLRLTIIDNTNDRPKNLDGARRLYPSLLSDHYPISL